MNVVLKLSETDYPRPQCPACGSVLPLDWRRCASCGNVKRLAPKDKRAIQFQVRSKPNADRTCRECGMAHQDRRRPCLSCGYDRRQALRKAIGTLTLIFVGVPGAIMVGLWLLPWNIVGSQVAQLCLFGTFLAVEIVALIRALRRE